METLLKETREEIMKLPQYQEQTELSGWKGGIVWLVPTFLKIEAWKPVAERVLKRENFECGSSNI
jgi:2',3'-cyclic-nucleotide 3'-phosphodiesterase